jgi:hypothetical protein
LSLISDIGMFYRFAGGLREFLEKPVAPGEAERRVTELLRQRRANFLKVVSEAIYKQEGSPYLALLRQAQIEYGDIEAMVGRDGVEHTLAHLRAAGVYVSLEEFKGRQPIVRPGFELRIKPSAFDNPIRPGHYEARSGGSRGPRARLAVDFDILELEAAQLHLLHLACGIEGRPQALWWTVPPGSAGMKNNLRLAKLGYPADHWFSQTALSWRPSGYRASIFTRFAVWRAKNLGLHLPPPQQIPLSQAGRVSDWLARQKVRGRPGVLVSSVGAGIRVCQAARLEGLDISGSTFRFAGEPLTPARPAIFAAAGCTAFCTYSTSESGFIGIPCGQGRVADGVHVLRDKMALVLGSEPASTDVAQALWLTTIHPFSPMVMLNLESGDSAIQDDGDCGCPLHELGLTQKLHTIRSYEKLSSEAMNVSAGELLKMVEQILPDQFGGQPGDYQFVEDFPDGLARVTLRISPRLGEMNSEDIKKTVYSFLADHRPSHAMTRAVWEQGRVLQIERGEPLATPVAKIQALHVIRDP